jgi:F-type H+-transporting ATPase subunit b
MPQINQLMLVYQSQWFWLLLVLAVIYFGVGKMMLPRIEAVVDSRNAKIAGDLAEAERARAAADAAEADARGAEEAARAEAHAVTGKAKASAAKDSEKALATADAEIAAKLAEAEAALAKAQDKALKSLEDIASEAAQGIVARLSGASVTPAQANAAVKAVLANG